MPCDGGVDIRMAKSRRAMTEFGRVLRQVMHECGVFRQADLARAFNARGFPMNQQRISAYMTGLDGAPSDFPEQLVDVLGLTQEQKDRVGDAYAYGQNTPAAIKAVG